MNIGSNISRFPWPPLERFIREQHDKEGAIKDAEKAIAGFIKLCRHLSRKERDKLDCHDIYPTDTAAIDEAIETLDFALDALGRLEDAK